MRKWSLVAPCIALILSCLAVPTLASDGVLEINQTCAVQTGCFAGDAAGFPVTISASGSYRLTSSLVVPHENADGIDVIADDVSIDLGGFEIRGPVVCSGSPVSCAPSGTGTGVMFGSGLETGTSVHNGSIRGMGSQGVRLGPQAEVTKLRVRSNRYSGIIAGTGSTVSGNTAHQNGTYGIVAGSGSTVFGNTASRNGAAGIQASDSTISGNTAYGNLDGIETGPGSLVKGNTVRSNTRFGLNLGTQSGYRENVISGNTTGTVTGGVNLGDNACNGTTTCP